METTSLYPPSPVDIPKRLTALTSSYQLRAILAILSILLFFVLYTALVIGLGYLVYYAIIYDMGRINKLTILAKVGAIAGAVMLFIFTLKFIFKLRNHQAENRIKLDKKAHPDLLNFILQICKETGAPKPRHIYVDPDVNAYVAYSNMWLSLFLPVRKDLTIGMGLVSCLNLTEFKAVMAHEFGHFAQRSMRIGSYIISANTIIHGMIYSRDSWDDLLDQWKQADFRLSAAAWVITPIIWLIRQVLALFYQLLNIMYSSLSREMEFNADKVAISVTGSDAIVSALWKLDNGNSKWSETLNHAYLASQKDHFVKNLYTHNLLALERSEEQQTELLEALPEDKRGGKQFFSHSEASQVSMYASHPPNDHRENNAKIPYIPAIADDRSPWALFSEVNALQEEMSLLIYQQYLKKRPKEFIESDDFEQFIHAETAGQALLEEYGNTFANRFLHIPSEEELAAVDHETREAPETVIAGLKAELTDLMQPVNEVEALMLSAQQIAQGASKESSFTYDGKVFDKSKLEEGYALLNEKREELFQHHFLAWDTKFCAAHLALAKQLGSEQDLKNIYKQYGLLSQLYKSIVANRHAIFAQLHQLQTHEEVSASMVTKFGRQVNEYVKQVNEQLLAFDKIDFVPLPNIESLSEFKTSIFPKGSLKKASGDMFENGEFNRVINELENGMAHCQRMDQKMISVILMKHHALQEAKELQ